jgi:catechol 2,3-dioxygenase-like lactoylglutathione lyase family enzyme
MFDHVEYCVSNIEAAEKFYASALAPLGWVQFDSDMTCACFGPPGGPTRLLISQSTTDAPLQKMHIAFEALTHDDVAAFFAAALQAGGTSNGEPGHRPQYSPNYYAAFVFDPDGNNIEAVCRL